MTGSVYVSCTRLVVRVRSLPAFLRGVSAVERQLQQVDGFLGGRLLAEPRLAFWTLTAWDGPRAMRAFRDGGAHAAVMPMLSTAGAEASFTGWWQEDATLPGWADVHRRLSSGATFAPLRRPRARHLNEQIAAPGRGLSQPLRPARPSRS